ncbi:uncharacterized protein N7503_005343 [Penicillium pulvis]|uniref:uncharacterized protein n=1 Tax=Penicillium pulvis TaxID=1562058 RepID=UPI0025470ECE|nr:uncharacterized protein N7503_005343 [Penicillium pulvis]KAJ5802893.1 hypothetical protein N7503_005343 [Penicillium pulvis]
MEEASSLMSLTLEESLYLFHHLFLPPKLPQADDYNARHENLLLNSVIDALRSFSGYVLTADDTVMPRVIEMITRLRQAHNSYGEVDEEQLMKSLTELPIQNGFLPIHVREQNAGILLSCQRGAIQIECFEVSARNGSVMSTVGRLRRDFPGPAMLMDRNTFDEPGFREIMAQTIARMSHQPVAGTKPKVKKAQEEHDEDRDTTHPKMVTELLMSILRPRCTDVTAAQISKNTRDEVMWLNCRSPWRRSPLWLLVRVILQLAFRRLSKEEGSDDLYKEFMIFFLAFIVGRVSNAMRSESHFLMSAKIVRRLLKLDLANEPAWFSSVQGILRRTTGVIEGQWKTIRSQETSIVEMAPLCDLDFRQDIQCALPCLDRYLKSIEKRGNKRLRGDDFLPQSKLITYQQAELPYCLDCHDSDYKAYNLAAFEDWVASCLNAWMEVHQGDEATCGKLGALITKYFERASSLYSDNPEAISVMLLTILELWIACDKSASHIHDNLREYDAYIPVDCFQSLLLPFRSQMARLACAEEYLSQRHAHLRRQNSNVFHDFGTSNCFAVRYFEQSNEHQQLLATIEAHAVQERARKKVELREKQQRYKDLMQKASETACQYNEVIVDKRFSLRERVHSDYCPKENYVREAKSIGISIHEWPLPTDPLRAKSTVFELRVPEPFASWRDITVFFLHNCLNSKYTMEERPRAVHRPETYQGLSSYSNNHGRNQRISLLSQEKPHDRTHRRDKLIVNVAENDVCLKNGLNFRFYDNTLACFVSDLNRTDRTEISCTYKLPPYSSKLQRYMFRPANDPNGPSPNTVIATQCDAPANMSLGEYKALAIMPLGLEIQWQNILIELAMPSVDMKKVETAIFMHQIINQVGPSKAGTSLRQGHAILCDDEFTLNILSRINETMGRIKDNWETIHGFNSLIRLTSKILSLSPSQKVRAMCLECLGNLRRSAFHWVKLVKTKASETIDDTHKISLVAKSVHIALVCAETFNVENIAPMFVDYLDISIFLQCSLVIWNGRNTLTTQPGSVLHILYHRWQVLSYRSHVVLAESIVQRKNPGMDMAIKAAWATYDVTSKWSKVSNDVNYWLLTRLSVPSEPNEGMLVHYNLLTGELLVDGLPLARLPSDYESHETYRTLFGKSQLEVMPSNSPGMQFSCQTQYLDHTVHVGKEYDPGLTNFDLTIKASKNEKVWQLLPSRLFAGDFPDDFVENYVHWYSVTDDLVEFRPAKTPWLTSSQSWRLQRSSSQVTWSLQRQGTVLISAISKTATVLSKVFLPVEKALKVHYIFDEATLDLHIELPRLRLEFILKSHSSAIQSRQYPGMSVDDNQSFDSLIGLRNKLLLKDGDSHDRVILIPEGIVSWARNDNHVHVEIGWQAATKIHAYSIDHHLGRLLDNGSLQSKLFLTYLHALTSFCLPDPLPRKTGTEQALSILRSASLRSFDRLEPEQTALLEKIASLTPAREFYPTNVQEMQRVHWQQGLGCLSQHHGFREEVAAILEQDRRMAIFRPETELSHPSLPHVEQTLLLRDQIRTASFRTSGFGAEDHTEKYDGIYNGLDKSRTSPEGSQSFLLCKMLYDEIPSIRRLQPEELTSHLWQFLTLSPSVQGPHAPFDTKRLRYDAEWVLDSKPFLASNWCCIHHVACTRNHRFSKFQLMSWLSVLAFSKKPDMIALETIASIFVISGLNLTNPPSRALFLPAEGFVISQPDIRRRIEWEQRLSTPESELAPEKYETYHELTSRRDRLQRQNRGLVLESLLLHYQNEWPTRSPSHPSSPVNLNTNDYFDAQNIFIKVSKLFNIWLDNRDLRQYINDLANVICSQPVEQVETHLFQLPHSTQKAQSKRGFVLLDDLLGPQPILEIEEPRLSEFLVASSSLNKAAPDLSALLSYLGVQAKSNYERRYVEQLKSSFTSLKDARQGYHIDLDPSKMKAAIFEYLNACVGYVDKMNSALVSQLRPSTEKSSWFISKNLFKSKLVATALEIQQCPRLSPILLLEQLSRRRWGPLDIDWKMCFITYGCSITKLQRAKRLASLVKHPDELLKELQNPGHTN